MVQGTFTVVDACFTHKNADGTVKDVPDHDRCIDVVQREFAREHGIAVPTDFWRFFPCGTANDASAVLVVDVSVAATGETRSLVFENGLGGRWTLPGSAQRSIPAGDDEDVDPCEWQQSSSDTSVAPTTAGCESPDKEIGSDGATLRVIDAWYGFEGGGNTTTGPCGRTVAALVTELFLDGATICVPGGLNAFFGDPLPNVLKVLALHVRDSNSNQDFHLRFHENIGGTWTVADGKSSPNSYNFPPKWRVADACYGTSRAAGSRFGHEGCSVIAIVQTLFGGDQVLRIQNNFNAYFGDPAPGRAKKLFIRLETNEGAARSLTINSGAAVFWSPSPMVRAGGCLGNSANVFETADDENDDACCEDSIEIVHAWYGFEGGCNATTGHCGNSVASIVAGAFIADGGSALRVPGNLNAFFGDPLPNVLKVLAVHVRTRVTRRDFHLRFNEHVGGSWSLADGQTSPHSYNFEPKWTVTYACYGTSRAAGSQTGLQGRTIASIVQSKFGGDQVLRMESNFNAYFGDPAPGHVKTLYVAVESVEEGAERVLTIRESTGDVHWSCSSMPSECGANSANVNEADEFSAENDEPRWETDEGKHDTDDDDAAADSPSIAVLNAWYGHPSRDPSAISRRVASPSVASTIVENFFDASTGRLCVPASMNQHFGDPAYGVVKALEFTLCVTGAAAPVALRFFEHAGGTVCVRNPSTFAAFLATTASSSGNGVDEEDALHKVRAELAREKRGAADLQEQLAERERELAQLRRRQLPLRR